MHIAPHASYAGTRYSFQIDLSINDDLYPGLELVCAPDTKQDMSSKKDLGKILLVVLQVLIGNLPKEGK